MSTIVHLDPLSVARDYAANPDDWPLAPRFDPHARWYHRLADGEPEVWLLTWLPGQGTPWHDHGGSAGAFVVVSGTLVEQTLGPEKAYSAGDGHAFGPDYVHRIVNLGSRPAVSVHAYGPALRSMTRYSLVDGQLLVEGVEKAGAQW